jgi:hypothetical protein
MKRTIATAQPLCDALGCKMELRPGLEEMHYGKWEDKTAEFVKEYYWDDYCLFLVIHLFGNLQLLLRWKSDQGWCWHETS